MSAHLRSGRCLCGSVTFTATPAAHGEGLEVDACHCGMCRRQVGGPLMTVGCSTVDVHSTGTLGIYASSDWAERGFCTNCGSNLFWRLKSGAFWTVNAGALDELSDARFAVEVFIDDKPGFYDFVQQTQKLTGAEVRALFAPRD